MLNQVKDHFVRIIGDVHAQIDFTLYENLPTYLEIIRDAPYSIQVGDMGDQQTYAELSEYEIDETKHRFIPGNHDHYPYLPKHCLGDFGNETLGELSFFFVRGAKSSDKDKLIQRGKETGRTLYFEEEELTAEQFVQAKEIYSKVRPNLMITHCAPTDFAHIIVQDLYGDNKKAESRTSHFLQDLFEYHQPKLWLFGHYHKDWHYQERETSFRCIGQLSYLDLDIDGNLRQGIN